MSKSFKKPIVKDKCRHNQRWYNRIYRRVWANVTRKIRYMKDLNLLEYPNRNVIIDFYDISDYKIDYKTDLHYNMSYYQTHDEWIQKCKEKNKKATRK